MLRSSPGGADILKSPLSRREDERQGSLDLGPSRPEPVTSVYGRIEQLSYENGQLRMLLAQGSGRADASRATYRAYHPLQGWIDKVDGVAACARGFADKLAAVTAIRASTEPDSSDAAAVNAAIALVAEEADALINALIADAEARDLTPSGPWMDIPLVECRAFQASAQDRASSQ
ncbi:hypothetical protein IP69_05955 [Bosea sp. AAP35]|nr:hypothetical protein IP69_05955 [Bosea sp. AAP35]